MELRDSQTGQPDDLQSDDLQALRQRIDGLDQSLLALLNQRAQASLDAARLKEDLGLPRLDQQREDQLVADLVAANPGPLSAEDIQTIYRLLLKCFRSLSLDSPAAGSSPCQEVE